MIQAIKELFQELTVNPDERKKISPQDIRLVSVALMTEVMLSDGDAGERERAALAGILVDEFHYPLGEVESFIDRAQDKVEASTSLFEFTDIVNRNFSNDEKFELIHHLWLIARADGVIHKLEEATIRKIADLIYVSHSNFIRAKQISR